MLDYKLKIGLIPERRWLADAATRKGIFAPKYAVENKKHILQYIRDHFEDAETTFTDLEWLNEEGLLSENNDVAKVAEFLKGEKVDAIFIINCNFGNEEAAGQIARAMQVPVLLWGPQDMSFEADGTRYTDCQCGLFAISKQLKRLSVPFTYIENCPVEDERFSAGFKKFFSIVSVVKNFRKLRVAQVGVRLNPFKSVMSNELELTEKFGINLQNVNMAIATQKLERIYKERRADLEKDLVELKKKYDVTGYEDELLIKMLVFVYFYIEIFEDTGADILSTECWTAMPAAFQANPCLAMSILYDMGYIVACESDIHGAISQAILMSAARGKNAPLFGEFTVRNPLNRNSELLWHCGPFPYSMKKEGVTATLYNTKPSFQVRNGEYTLARFQGEGGKYTLLGGKFHTTEGPKTFGTYLWAEFKDLAKLERKLINGPYIHHMSEIWGDYSEVLEEAVKYIPNLEFDPLED